MRVTPVRYVAVMEATGAAASRPVLAAFDQETVTRVTRIIAQRATTPSQEMSAEHSLFHGLPDPSDWE